MDVPVAAINATDVRVAVLPDMSLHIAPTDIGRQGEHNSCVFRITRQPESLDGLACRAEVSIGGKKTYRLVIDGAFNLTNDITEVSGPGTLQLVYSDGTEVIRKTTLASFHVTTSIDAVDPSDPTFQDGLAQLQSQAFASVIDPPPGGDVATFFNISGSPAGYLRFPTAVTGGDLTEERADTLYLRLTGASMMQGSVGIAGANRGITWEDSGRQGALYSTGTQLVLRLPEGDPPFVIEPNSGSAGLRSPVLTQQAGDTRYVLPQALDAYLLRAGGQMTGPLITATGTGLTNPGLGIGDNGTGFYRTGGTLLLSVGGALYTQYLASPPSVMMTVPLNMATQLITNVADAVAPTDGANRRTVESMIATALALQPRPNSRTYLTNTVDLLNTTAQILLDQLYPVANNAPRTIVVTVFPTFQGGTPSAFYDLIYTCSVAPLIEARSTVYPTAGAYMQSPVRFAATVTPNNNSIQVQIVVRLNAVATGPLTIVGSSTDKRSYATIEEMVN